MVILSYKGANDYGLEWPPSSNRHFPTCVQIVLQLICRCAQRRCMDERAIVFLVILFQLNEKFPISAQIIAISNSVAEEQTLHFQSRHFNGSLIMLKHLLCKNIA